MAILKITGNDSQYSLSLEHAQRFTSTGNIGGVPVDGIKAGDRGLLPEPYHAAAQDAEYAVYHHETPILWRARDGKWYAPGHKYSQTTSAYRNKMCRALLLRGITVETI